MVLDSGSELGVPPELPPGNFQSSLRDFSSFESLPRTASWAKFSRPCGTHFAIGSHAGLKAVPFKESAQRCLRRLFTAARCSFPGLGSFPGERLAADLWPRAGFAEHQL